MKTRNSFLALGAVLLAILWPGRAIAGPSIKEMYVDEDNEQLHVLGTFDKNSPATVFVFNLTAAPTKFTFGQFFRGGFLPPNDITIRASHDATFVSAHEVVCPLPAAGPGSAGLIVVQQNDDRSFPRALTEWRGEILYGGSQSGLLDVRATFSLHFRTDVSGPHAFPIYAAKDSFGQVTADGQTGTGRTWGGSAPLTLVPINQIPGTNNFSFVANVDPRAIPAKASKVVLKRNTWNLQLNALLSFSDTNGPSNTSTLRLATELSTGITGPLEVIVGPDASLVSTIKTGGEPGAKLEGGAMAGTGFINGDSADSVETLLTIFDDPADPGIGAQYYQK